MSDDLCPREADVLRACESGAWTDALTAHVATCGACRDVQAVATALQRAVAEEEALPLPDAGDLWWKARLHAEREARQRAMRPLDTMERAEPLVALVAIVAVLVLRGEAIGSWFVRLLAGEAGGQALQVFLPSAVLPFVFVGIGLGLVVIFVGLSAVVARD